MNTFEQIALMKGHELSKAFQVSKDAGYAAESYLTTLAWGHGVKAATEAASDFINEECDLMGLKKILLHVKNLQK